MEGKTDSMTLDTERLITVGMHAGTLFLFNQKLEAELEPPQTDLTPCWTVTRMAEEFASE